MSAAPPVLPPVWVGTVHDDDVVLATVVGTNPRGVMLTVEARVIEHSTPADVEAIREGVACLSDMLDAATTDAEVVEAWRDWSGQYSEAVAVMLGADVRRPDYLSDAPLKRVRRRRPCRRKGCPNDLPVQARVSAVFCSSGCRVMVHRGAPARRAK